MHECLNPRIIEFIYIFHPAKKNPRQDLAHLQFGNTEPLVEGENSVLVRTGSDGCLNQHNTSNDDTLPNVSSSSYMYFNIVAKYINSDEVDN